MRQAASRAGLLVLVLVAVGCGVGGGDSSGVVHCTGSADCPGGICVDGICRRVDGGDVAVPPDGDADVPPHDVEPGDGADADADGADADGTSGDGADADVVRDGTTDVPLGPEICGDGIDNDGDTLADEGCACAAGATQPCYVGTPGAAGVGTCAMGSQTCLDDGEFGAWGPCEGAVPPGDEVCGDGLDNDCDGSADEGCTCTSGDRRSCYTGPAGTAGVGECRAGTQYCLDLPGGGTGWSDCGGQTLPAADVCDGLDNDCDGVADQGCTCPPGTTRSCYGGPADTRGRGLCSDGNQSCVADSGGVLTDWGLCLGWTGPSGEICGDHVDNDCDGMTDEGCGCLLGGTRSCYTGPLGTEGEGVCRAGRQVCVATPGGTDWGDCTGSVVPSADVCDGLDNDCDGTTDNLCDCPPFAEESCYPGPAGTRGVGVCIDGRHECLWSTGSTTSSWGPCSGWHGPDTEICDGIDNDCDGMIDEGCTCTRGVIRPCYSGPSGTSGVGICRAGSQTCIDIGGGMTGWGSCTGEVTPATEICIDGLDNDCDGMTDEFCACSPGAVRSCYSGPSGTSGVGICRAGSQSCAALPGGGSAWSACAGQVVPGLEMCANGLDDDCDGSTDEGCTCTPGAVRACYDGPAITRGIGECRDGSQVCTETPGAGSSWGACTGERLPATEICGNGLDDDCDGSFDEACSHPPWTTCPASPVVVAARATITLTASDGDAGGDIVSRRWEVTSGPPGMIYTLGCATCASTSFRADIAGVYMLRYTVTDSRGDSSSCIVQINVTGLGLRIEVTWTSSTADIDTHLLNGSGGWWSTYSSDGNDCHWRNCRGGLAWNPGGTAGDARLDIDDVDGYGPENINVDVINIGEDYRVGIHWWDGHGATVSDVSVRIFCGDISAVPVRTYARTLHGTSVGASSSNDLWKVADVVFTDPDHCNVTDINTVGPSGPSNISR